MSGPVRPPQRLVDVTRQPGMALPVSAAELRRVIDRALDAAGAPISSRVGLILSDDVELATLNATYMGKEGPTDVLSFPLLPPSAFPPHPGQDPALRGRGQGDAFVLPPRQRIHLGEMIVSLERAVAQAAAGRGGQTGDVRWSAADELRLLATHGALHLCGWDHADPVEEAAMRALERELLAVATTG